MVYCYRKYEAGKVLKELRANKKLTQQYVADKLGVTRGYISQVELGTRPLPRYRFLIKVLEMYGVKPKYFEELVSKVGKV
jgi:transcriptional regulator with XRE-family HTH domain